MKDGDDDMTDVVSDKWRETRVPGGGGSTRRPELRNSLWWPIFLKRQFPAQRGGGLGQAPDGVYVVRWRLFAEQSVVGFSGCGGSRETPASIRDTGSVGAYFAKHRL